MTDELMNYVVKNDMNRFIRNQDERVALGRFTWYNLPDGLTGDFIEYLLYYEGQCAFFYMEDEETFYFLPYALGDTVDIYGRSTSIIPLSLIGGMDRKEPWIQGLTKTPVYDVVLDEDLCREDIMDSTVLLFDYSKGSEESIVPRATLNESLIETMSKTILAIQSSSVNNTEVNGIVNEMAQKQPLLMTYQLLDNLRLSSHGISTPTADNINAQLILQDGLHQRQRFCTILNSIWYLGTWCEISDNLQLNKNADISR